MENLQEIREKWYLAYKRGDVQELRKYESSRLIVEVNGEVESSERYAHIDQQFRSNTWFQPELLREEEVKSQEGSGEVTGRAEVIEGKAKGHIISYQESWKCIESVWQIEHLAIMS